jgi:hypothetical protein
VTDFNEIRKYSILPPPRLLINEKAVSTGRIPNPMEVTAWLADALETV